MPVTITLDPILVAGIRGKTTVLNKLLQPVAIDVAQHWHTNFHPIHYTREALSRYNMIYTPRAGDVGSPEYAQAGGRYTSYTMWKMWYTARHRGKSHRRPLVLSGKRRAFSLSTKPVINKGTYGTVIEAHVPVHPEWQLFTTKSTNNHKLLEELQAITPQELQTLDDVAARSAETHILGGSPITFTIR